MKTICTLVVSLVMVATVFAQAGDTWKIMVNKKQLQRVSGANSQATVVLERKLTTAKNTITIQYKTAEPQSDFKRIFYINDDKENVVKRLELTNPDGAVSFNSKDLKAAAHSNKPLSIYTTSIPKDPAMAASVRVRRFLVCKIEWK